MAEDKLTFRRYEDGDHITTQWSKDVVQNGLSEICPTYIHRTPPCQASCPSGHDIRGWLSIVRGIDKPLGDTTWQEYAFRRMTMSNPFPSVMGRVCPAPCEDGCNRNEVEEAVGINAVEQYVGDWALKQNLDYADFVPQQESGKKVAIVGGGCAGLTAAYFLRQRGHACTIFDSYSQLGGMMVFGIPGYRTPRSVLEGEISRIIDMGVEVRLNTQVGTDVTVAELEKDFDAVFWGIGAIDGKKLPIPGGDAPNCVDGMSYLRAFNEGRLKYLDGRVLVIGAGDTAMDVLAVARRIGNIHNTTEKDHPDNVILGHTVHDVATVASRKSADVWVVYRRPISQAPATKHELDAVIREGVEIHDGLSPIEVIKDDMGRAKALKVAPVEQVDGELKVKEDEAFDIECKLIVSATGQAGNYTGLEEFDNGKGLMDADNVYQVVGKPGHFVAGDAVKPHLLTTAIGQASIAAEGIDHYLNDREIPKRPKIDTHHFKLLDELRGRGLGPEKFEPDKEVWGTDSSGFAVHNYEDRSSTEIATSDQLHLAYFEHEMMNRRDEADITAENVLSNFQERFSVLEEEKAIEEAARCMSCGMCFECDNCVVYCPEDAIFRVKKDQRAMGRYVDTDYDKCVGCHICADVCPSGYIKMGLTY